MAGAARDRWLFALAALLLLPLLAWRLLAPLGPAADAPAGTGDDTSGQAALARWDGLWAALDAQGEAALRPAVTDSSLRAAGDTVFMRYASRWDDAAAPARRAFEQAALTNDPARKLALLQPWTQAAQDIPPPVRQRAWLEIARVRLRQRALEPARMAARAALAVPGLPERLAADPWFILASIALEAGAPDDAERALARAVTADPGFWDARQLELRVLASQLGQPRQTVAGCLERTRRLIETLGALPVLARDRAQLRDVADHLAGIAALPNPASNPASNPALALVSGLGYRWSGDRQRADAALAAARDTRGSLPAPCAARINARARALLTSG